MLNGTEYNDVLIVANMNMSQQEAEEYYSNTTLLVKYSLTSMGWIKRVVGIINNNLSRVFRNNMLEAIIDGGAGDTWLFTTLEEFGLGEVLISNDIRTIYALV